MRVRQSVPIEIRNCSNYSIGESEEGYPLIWVLGRGGWYEINPSDSYRPIHRVMCEATTLYYQVMDTYGSLPKKFRKTKQSEYMIELSEIFLKVGIFDLSHLINLSN